MLSLNYSYQTKVERAYIITINNNATSERYSLECQKSCRDVGMDYVVWEAFDGHSNPIKAPPHLEHESFLKALKVMDHYKTRTEIASALSHISLWLECAKLDRPIVVLEHDAVMIKKFEEMKSFNSVVYLGCHEWKEGWPIYPIPPHNGDGNNYRFVFRLHAYAIDPAIAKNLLAYCLKYGILGAADYFMRVDLFNISHQGFYAYDNMPNYEGTTIVNRRLFDNRKRNDNFIY
jgi:hypothetical protein